MAQRTRQHSGIDAAGRGAGDDINDDAQLDLAANIAQELEVVGLGIVFRVARSGLVEKRSLDAPGAVGDSVQSTRGTRELQNLLADAVYIDGERNAAEADKRDAKFFLAQE